MLHKIDGIFNDYQSLLKALTISQYCGTSFNAFNKNSIMAIKNTMKEDKQKITSDNPAETRDNESTDNEFPGYPHYSKTEDIMDSRNDAERVNVDVENLPNFHNATTAHRLNSGIEEITNTSNTENIDDADADLGIKMGTDADVSAEERKMLEDDMYLPTQDEDNLRQARLDDTDFDGEKLNEETQVESGDDLDMDVDPDETNREVLGEGDEENQYWSLGSDNNDNVVEGTP